MGLAQSSPETSANRHALHEAGPAAALVLTSDDRLVQAVRRALGDAWRVGKADRVAPGGKLPQASLAVVDCREDGWETRLTSLSASAPVPAPALVAYADDPSAAFAVRAARAGVQEVLVEGRDEDRTACALAAALERQRILNHRSGPPDRRHDPFRSILDTSPVMQFVFDPDGDRLLYVNPAAAALFEDAPRAAVDRRASRLLSHCHPEDRRQLLGIADQLTRAGRDGPLRKEIRWRDGQGRYRSFAVWFAASGLSAAGMPDRVAASAVDVTDLYGVEYELSRTNELLERMFDSLQLQVAVLDEGLRVARINDAFLRMIGMERNDVLGRPLVELFPEADLQQHMEQVLKTAMPRFFFERGELRSRHGNREMTYWDWSIQPVRNRAGRVDGLLVTMLDVSSRVAFREKLSREKRRLQQLLTKLPGYVILLGPDRTIRFANKRFRELFGDPEGLHCFEVQHGRGQPCDVCRMHEVVRCQEVRQWEWTDGRGRCYEVWASPFVDEDGNALVLELGTDITRRKHLERRVDEIAENERRRIGQDLHDLLGQNLTGIALMAKVLADRLDEGPFAEAARTVCEQANRSVSLTRSIARGLCPTGIDREGLLAGLQELADNSSATFGIRCRFEASPSVRVEDGLMASHMYCIVREAVNNAVRHGGAETVRIVLDRHDGEVELTIADNGKGFDVNEKSSGMGLHTMQYRAETIGGRIAIDSVRGEGATVRVTFRVPDLANDRETDHES